MQLSQAYQFEFLHALFFFPKLPCLNVFSDHFLSLPFSWQFCLSLVRLESGMEHKYDQGNTQSLLVRRSPWIRVFSPASSNICWVRWFSLNKSAFLLRSEIALWRQVFVLNKNRISCRVNYLCAEMNSSLWLYFELNYQYLSHEYTIGQPDFISFWWNE